jgi:ubiquinone/menaquinone biosynthesis C-methylase UbiE
MDNYTRKTKVWLDHRYKLCGKDKIYFAHQPIYGFRKGHSEPDTIERYIRTYQIMKALFHVSFSSLLDVGAAEGYHGHIVQQLFGFRVICSDLSEEACKRAKEIFNMKTIASDIQNLPFKDNSFDVILYSETLEHVPNLQNAIDEMLRVAKKQS